MASMIDVIELVRHQIVLSHTGTPLAFQQDPNGNDSRTTRL
jgi:hypothetical protein